MSILNVCLLLFLECIQYTYFAANCKEFQDAADNLFDANSKNILNVFQPHYAHLIR